MRQENYSMFDLDASCAIGVVVYNIRERLAGLARKYKKKDAELVDLEAAKRAIKELELEDFED